MDTEKFHSDAIVIDTTAPVAVIEDILTNFRQGGVTAVAATVGYGQKNLGTINYTTRNLGKWLERIRRNSDTLMHITSVEDFTTAKKENKLGIIFHFQGTIAIEDDLNVLEVYHRLGLRMCQLCYNNADLVGYGCTEKEDRGLTDFGREAIKEMNRLGVIVDCAHTGLQTTLDAVKASEYPVMISHGNARAVHSNARNLPDNIIKAIADNEGVIGVNGYPAFVSGKPVPDVDDYINHIDYYKKLVGVDYICIGMDYFEYQAGVLDNEKAMNIYNYLIDSGSWSKEDYPPPPWHYPEGIEMPEKFGNLTAALFRRGYTEDEVTKILGGNYMRVCRQVWK